MSAQVPAHNISRIRRFIVAGALIAATLILYQPVGHYQFLNYDDDEYVTANSHVRSGLTLHNVAWAFTSLDASNWHPLTWISHMADYQLFGLRAGGHHYSNVLLHAINVALLFLLLERATRAFWRSFIVAALFAFHPLNIETVAWISERKSLLSALFSFLTIASYGWYVSRRNAGRYLVIAASFAFALMSKPMAVTLPAILLLLDYWPLGRFSFDQREMIGPAKQASFLVLEKLPLFMMSGASACITIIAQKNGGSVAAAAALPLAIRLKNATVSYALYVRKMFWPAKLAIFYPYPANSLTWLKLAVAIIVLVGITVLAVRLYRKPYFPVGWFIFLLTLVPVIGIVQVGRQAMADRYAYLPLIGLFIIVAWGGMELSEWLAIGPAVRTTAVVCALIATAFATRLNLPYWQDSLSLFTRAREVASAPDYQIEDNLGKALDSAGRYDEALQHFRAALALNDRDPIAHYNFGTYLLRTGNAPDAVHEFQTALEYASDKTVRESSFNNLGLAYLLLGNYLEAERNYTAAIDIDPLHYSSLLGRGQTLYREGRYHDAADDFARALTIDSGPVVYLWWGEALEGEGKLQAAIAAYSEALHRNPDLIDAKSRLRLLREQAVADTLQKR